MEEVEDLLRPWRAAYPDVAVVRVVHQHRRRRWGGVGAGRSAGGPPVHGDPRHRAPRGLGGPGGPAGRGLPGAVVPPTEAGAIPDLVLEEAGGLPPDRWTRWAYTIGWTRGRRCARRAPGRRCSPRRPGGRPSAVTAPAPWSRDGRRRLGRGGRPPDGSRCAAWSPGGGACWSSACRCCWACGRSRCWAWWPPPPSSRGVGPCGSGGPGPGRLPPVAERPGPPARPAAGRRRPPSRSSSA